MGTQKEILSSGAATRFAFDCQAQFLGEKRSELYKKVLLTSIAVENCAWHQEDGKVSALPEVSRLARKV